MLLKGRVCIVDAKGAVLLKCRRMCCEGEVKGVVLLN